MTRKKCPACYGGILGDGDDGFPVFCEGCLEGLTLLLDWLVQQLASLSAMLEFAPVGVPYIAATETALEALLKEHDRILKLYDEMDGYNASTNPEGQPVGHIPYWPRFPTRVQTRGRPQREPLPQPKFVRGRW